MWTDWEEMIILADSRLKVRQARSESRRRRESFSIESEIKARTSSSILLSWSFVCVWSGGGWSCFSCFLIIVDGSGCSDVPTKKNIN